MSYTIEWGDGVCIFSFFGDSGGNDLIACSEVFHGDSRFDNARLTIWDMSAVEDFNLTVEECIKIAAQDIAASKTNPRIKTAIIATDEIVEMFANLYESEMLSSPWETKVFKTKEEAMRWAP